MDRQAQSLHLFPNLIQWVAYGEALNAGKSTNSVIAFLTEVRHLSLQ